MDPTLAVALAGTSLMLVRTMVRHATTSKDKLPIHPSRGEILDILRTGPGTNITELCTLTGQKWGTVQYHIRLLERSGLIESRRFSRERKFFLKGTAPKEFDKLALLGRGRIAKLVEEVRMGPGQVQQDLTRKLGMTRKVFGNYRNLLASAGLLTEVRAGRTRRYYPTAELSMVTGSADLHPPQESGRSRAGAEVPR